MANMSFNAIPEKTILAKNSESIHPSQQFFSHDMMSSLKMSNTPDRRQSKTLLTIHEHGSKIARNSVFDIRLSPVRQQMAINNSVSNNFLTYLRR